MSNPRAKAERSAAKDIRQGITEQRPVSVNSKKKPQYEVICDLYFMSMIREGCRLGKFHKLVDAEKCAKAASKKGYYVNVRIIEL